jgi:hypothetical protein
MHGHLRWNRTLASRRAARRLGAIAGHSRAAEPYLISVGPVSRRSIIYGLEGLARANQANLAWIIKTTIMVAHHDFAPPADKLLNI